MDVGRIEATLTAKFDKDPFDKYERAINGAQREARTGVTARLRGNFDGKGFQTFDREATQARNEARRPITQQIKTDYDSTGMRRYRDEQGRLRNERGQYVREGESVDRANRRTSSGFTALATNARFLAGTAGIAGLGIAFRSMYQEQAEAQAAGAQLRAVLASMGTEAGVTEGHMNSLADSISKKAAVDDEAVVSTGALMLTFGKVRNEAGKNNDIFDRSIQASVDLSRAFGKDLQGSTIMLGKALNDPIKGLTAMTRVGVSFTEGQKEQVKAMVASGDTLGAQKLILAELERQVGGSAEAYGKTLPGAVDRAKIAFGNLMENLGGRVAPAVSAVADAISGLLDGSAFKGGGTFARAARPIIDGFKAIQTAAAPIVKEIGRAFSDIFGGGQSAGFKRDLREIGKALGDALTFMAAVVRRVAPAISGWFRGVFDVIAGVVKIVGGILRGDWNRVWQGAKQVVSGALRAIWSLIRGVTAPIREVLSRLFAPVAGWFRSAWNSARNAVSSGARAVVNAVRAVIGAAGSAARSVGRAITGGFDVVADAAGKVRGFISRAVGTVRSLAGSAASAARSVGSGIVNGIVGAIRGGASTVLNAILSLLPAKLRGPARSVLGLAMGGKVGPNSGGPRMFVAGEGGKDEWVISQEGPKAANIAWAVEALETLTGRRVAMFRNGGKPTKANLKKALGKIPSTWKSGLQTRVDKLEQADTEYGQMERRYSIGSDEFLTSNADGSVTVNRDVVAGRITELDNLVNKKNEIEKLIKDIIDWINDTAKRLKTAIDLLRALGKKANKKTRKKYDKKADAYSEARGEMLDALPDLRNDLVDVGIDLDELRFEREQVKAYYGQGKGPDQTDPGGGDGGGVTDPAPSPEDLASAAAEQVATFTANRASLFSAFGQNFIGQGGTLTPLTQAAGFRYFGGGQADGGGILGASGGFGNAGMNGAGGGSAGDASGGGVIITNNYAAPPPDPHTWSRNLAWEVKTAVS